MTQIRETAGEMVIVGGGPSSLVAAIALARRGLRTSVLEREVHPALAPRFNPDRSYTIDISGHGLKALRHIDASTYFDDRMIQFKGLKIPGGITEEWKLPGWTGSRGDILRALMALAEEHYGQWISFEFECRVTAVDVEAGIVTYADKSGGTRTRRCDLIIGCDGVGSVVRNAIREQVPGFSVETASFPTTAR